MSDARFERSLLLAPGRGRMLPRLLLVILVLLAGLLMLGPRVSRAQEAPAAWSHPRGAFTVQWAEPWTVLRQEAELIVVTNGTLVAAASDVVPALGVSLSICLTALTDELGTAGTDTSQPVLMETSTWRAYAAYNNVNADIIDYFECQTTPDGQSVVLLVGGVPRVASETGLPALIEFMGRWVVQQQGESSPTVAAGGWRAGIIERARGSVHADLGLPAAEAGAEHLVLIADLTNWQAATPELPVTAISLRSADGGREIPVDVGASNRVAASLGEQPLEASGQLNIPAGQSRRVALAFSIDSAMTEPVFSLNGQGTFLADDGIPARFVVLPPPASLPALQQGTITSVTDGRTLRVELAETGTKERVRLIGLADPVDGAAEERLAAFIGQQVLLEADPAVPDDNRLQRYVWATGEDGLPLLLNALLIEENMMAFEPGTDAARFDAMLGAGQAHSDETVVVDPSAEPAAPGGDPTEAELAYLTELREQREFTAVYLEYYDMQTAVPAPDETFYDQILLVFMGWSLSYDAVNQMSAPPAYADLHARYVAALQPFDLLAHQMEPDLDLWFAGEIGELTLANFDYDVLVSTVTTARPELENVLAEIDQALAAAGIA